MAFLLSAEPDLKRRARVVRLEPGTRVVPASALSALRTSEEIISAACADADAILENARQSFASESARGYQEGTALANREAAANVLKQAALARQYMFDVEERLVGVVMHAMRRIVNDYSDEQRVVHVVRDALSVMRTQKEVSLRVHPLHADHVLSQVENLRSRYPAIELIDVAADARLAPDACVLESAIGTVEASASEQLAALEAALSNAGTPASEPEVPCN